MVTLVETPAEGYLLKKHELIRDTRTILFVQNEKLGLFGRSFAGQDTWWHLRGVHSYPSCNVLNVTSFSKHDELERRAALRTSPPETPPHLR